MKKSEVMELMKKLGVKKKDVPSELKPATAKEMIISKGSEYNTVRGVNLTKIWGISTIRKSRSLKALIWISRGDRHR